jgi:hypothetical protein
MGSLGRWGGSRSCGRLRHFAIVCFPFEHPTHSLSSSSSSSSLILSSLVRDVTRTRLQLQRAMNSHAYRGALRICLNSHTLSHSLTHSHSYSLSHTHTLPLSLFFSLFPSLSRVLTSLMLFFSHFFLSLTWSRLSPDCPERGGCSWVVPRLRL